MEESQDRLAEAESIRQLLEIGMRSSCPSGRSGCYRSDLLRILPLVRKIHIYAGLLTLSQLGVYGVAGLVATFQPGRERAQNAAFGSHGAVPGAAFSTDKEVARLVYDTLRPPLSRPCRTGSSGTRRIITCCSISTTSTGFTA